MDNQLEKKQWTIVGLGELLWDLFPDRKELGGAPANFAYHAKMLGAKSFIVSAIGDDLLGRDLLQSLSRMGMDSSYIQRNHQNTGTVAIDFDLNGEPLYEISFPNAWDFIQSKPILDLAKTCDAVCVGTLAQRSAVSRQCIQAFLDACPETALRIFDLNLRSDTMDRELLEETLRKTKLLKMNETEKYRLETFFSADLRDLMQVFYIDYCAISRAEKGSYLLTKEAIFEGAAVQCDFCSPVGAGDAFTAALCMKLLEKSDFEEALHFANRYASLICSKPGAMPEMKNHDLESLQ